MYLCLYTNDTYKYDLNFKLLLLKTLHLSSKYQNVVTVRREALTNIKVLTYIFELTFNVFISQNKPTTH